MTEELHPDSREVPPVSRPEELRARTGDALRQAMRERDRDAVTALRGLSARWANAEAVPVDVLPPAGALEGAAIGVGAADASRRELDAAELLDLAQAEIDEHERAAAEREALGRAEDAASLRRQAEVIRALVQ